MTSGSVDQTNNYVFDVLPRGVAVSLGMSLQYWSTGNGDDTMITLWNPADESQDFKITLFFDGGHYILPLHLEPRATGAFNISELLQGGPDAEGNIVPASVHEGSMRINGSVAENQEILIAMASGVYNVRKATCGGGCQTCDGYSDAYVQAGTFGVWVNSTNQLNFMGVKITGGTYNLGGTWSSSKTSVATIGSGTGLAKGVAAGAAMMSVYVDNLPVSAGQLCGGESCPTDPFVGQSAATVRIPTSSSIVSTTSSGPATNCAAHQAGWSRQVLKIVTDQNAADIVLYGQNLDETVTVTSPNQLNTTGTPQTGTAITNSDGEFSDTFFVCSPNCPGSGATDASQTISDGLPSGAGPYNLSPNTIAYQCSSITVNGQ